MLEDIDLGEKLTITGTDKKKIFWHVLLRLVFVLIIVLAGIRSNPPAGLPVSFLAILIAGLIILAVVLWIVYPLFHIKDYVAFYENGIDFCGKKFEFSELGEITFLTVKSACVFTKIYMQTDMKDFNITYIEQVKKCFNRAYHRTI